MDALGPELASKRLRQRPRRELARSEAAEVSAAAQGGCGGRDDERGRVGRLSDGGEQLWEGCFGEEKETLAMSLLVNVAVIGLVS